MLEKIGTPEYRYVSTPDAVVLKYISSIKALMGESKNIVFYEIGLGIGATTLEVARQLSNAGEIVLFSRDRDVQELSVDLRNQGYTNINGNWGSPSKIFSGYHFKLAIGFVEQKLPPFDLAYVDGGHTFHLDAPAACVLKELCKPGGYILFDDWSWSLAKSPTNKPSVRPEVLKEFDALQIERAHVELVCKAIMDPDRRFKFLGVEADTAVYQRHDET